MIYFGIAVMDIYTKFKLYKTKMDLYNYTINKSINLTNPTSKSKILQLTAFLCL